MFRRVVLLVYLGIGLPGLATAAIDGQVRAVGLPFSASDQHAVRRGCWFPIVVELQARGNEHLAVELVAESADLDGDRVNYGRANVTLTANAGLQRFVCYAMAEPFVSTQSGTLPTTIDVVDTATRRVLLSLPLPRYEVLEESPLLILDISRQPLSGLQQVLVPEGGEPSGYERPYYRQPIFGRLNAADLPDRWYGLEAVSVVVWDEPDPQPAAAGAGVGRSQLDALLTWVRNGGQLVVGIGAAADRLAGSPLADLLPFELTGGTRSVTTLERFYSDFGDRRAERGRPGPLVLANVKTRPEALSTYWDRGDGSAQPLIAMWNVGAGRVVAVAGSVRGLTRPGVRPEFYAQLLDLYPQTSKFAEAQRSLLFQMTQSGRNVGSELLREIDYRATGQLKALAALVFVAAYIVLATLVTWVWLVRQRRTTWAWSVFGVVAVGASALSLGAVNMSRGLWAEAKTVSLVDVTAGQATGRATCWFGYYSPRPDRVELSLGTAPGDGSEAGAAYLRPLSPPDPTTRYATVERYAAWPERGVLRDVPLRATLKQFEGFWSGDLGGTVRASLTVDRASGRITPGSWIANDLPAGVGGGWLLYFDPRVSGAQRPAATRRAHRAALGVVPAAYNVLVVSVGPLGAGDRSPGPRGAAEYRRHDEALAAWRRRAEGDNSPPPDLPTLWAQQIDWVARILPGFGELAALASTHSMYLPSTERDFDQVGRLLNRRGLPDRDVTHWLREGQAVLLLWSDEPGPAVLHRDGRPFPAVSGRTLYRVRVPLLYTGSAPRGTDE